MIQNTLTPTLNMSKNQDNFIGNGRSEFPQDLENAGKLIDKHIHSDSLFPSLFEKFRLSSQGFATVSGLSEHDYPVGLETTYLRHLHTLRKVPLPADLVHHFQHMQCNSMMGLFPEIERAWLCVDSDIYVWVYKDGSDLAYFDGLHDTILSVGMVKPKAGVFKSYIEYLLCLATPTEIILLGVSFSKPGEQDSCVSMHLLSEPLFTVSSDGEYILHIKGTEDGRIFMGAKDGSLWELVYKATDGWFSRKCYKVNHSRSSLSFILPSFLALSEDDPIQQIEKDESRHVVYTLTEKGNVSIYDLGDDGQSMSFVLTLHHNNITNTCLQIANTVDKSNFKNFIAISAIKRSESAIVHLVLITGTGVRLYYTTTPLSSPYARPTNMILLHIRLPPGFAANALTHRPTKVHKATLSNGTCVLCAKESSDSDVIWSMNGDHYPHQNILAESHAVLGLDRFVWALADVTPPLWCANINPPTVHGTSPPLLVTQHQQPPRQLVLISSAGTHILTALRPVDQLRSLLQDCGTADAPPIREFFLSMSLIQACATALILAMDPNLQDAKIAELSTHAIFRYGTTKDTSIALNQQNTAAYSFQPSQVSTPVSSTFNQLQSPQTTMISSQPQQQTSSQHFTPIHDALYLYLARVLRPVWNVALVREEILDEKRVFTSVINVEEVSFLARNVEYMSNFMLLYQGPGQKSGLRNQNGTSNNLVGENVSERSSLLALRGLLSQCLEVLRLWTVLVTHNFSLISVGLSREAYDQIKNVTLRDLVLNGRDLIRNLILALLDRYHGDNASVDTISNRLRDVAPTLFRSEDANIAKANEIILAAKNKENIVEKESLFRQAVDLCKQIGCALNIGGICSQLASGSWYEGVVDLCLSVANQRDQSCEALHFYKMKEPNNNQQGYGSFNARMECYRVIIDHISQLLDSTSTLSSNVNNCVLMSQKGPTEATQLAEKMINLVTESNDELAHVTLYQYLVESNRTDRLLVISSPFLENFLLKGQETSRQLNDLLWRYYERNREYFKAAKTLAQLVDSRSDIDLHTRIEHLSRALMCLSSNQMTTKTSFADFVLHLEEKKDVARVQLMVLEALQSKNVSSDVINCLNSNLRDITELYEKFAEPYNLWQCKLAIVHCAGHSEPQLIRSLWSHIIDDGLTNKRDASNRSTVDSFALQLKTLARTYSLSPSYFPLEHIIKMCEIKSVQLKIEKTCWVADVLRSCGVPISKLIAIYHRLYSSGDGVWVVERSPYHLLKVISDLFNLVADVNVSLSSQERRALREECLDYISAYLTDVGSNADQSAADVSNLLKICQNKLERIAH